MRYYKGKLDKGKLDKGKLFVDAVYPEDPKNEKPQFQCQILSAEIVRVVEDKEKGIPPIRQELIRIR